MEKIKDYSYEKKYREKNEELQQGSVEYWDFRAILENQEEFLKEFGLNNEEAYEKDQEEKRSQLVDYVTNKAYALVSHYDNNLTKEYMRPHFDRWFNSSYEDIAQTPFWKDPETIFNVNVSIHEELDSFGVPFSIYGDSEGVF